MMIGPYDPYGPLPTNPRTYGSLPTNASSQNRLPGNPPTAGELVQPAQPPQTAGRLRHDDPRADRDVPDGLPKGAAARLPIPAETPEHYSAPPLDAGLTHDFDHEEYHPPVTPEEQNEMLDCLRIPYGQVAFYSVPKAAGHVAVGLLPE